MSASNSRNRRGGILLLIVGLVLILIGVLSSDGIMLSAGDDIAMAVALILTLVCLTGGIVAFAFGVRLLTKRQ